MKTVDTRGKLCPQPLIDTRRAIASAQVGETFEVIADNVTAKNNLLAFLSELGFAAECSERGAEFFITFTAITELKPVAAEQFCTPAPAKPAKSAAGYAVAIKSEFMGEGDDGLGSILMRGCLNSLAELPTLPSVVVLYNSGVKLAEQGSDTAVSLALLKSKGVAVVACGMCVDFFELKEKVTVAQIGNMLLINELLSSASHIIYP